MADLPGNRQFVQTQSVLTRAPVSENLFQNISGNVNFVNESHLFTHVWKINGNYSTTAVTPSVDNLFTFRNKSNGVGTSVEIVDVVLAIDTPGSSGVTQIDLKYSLSPGGSFTSIFTTMPSADPSAAHYSWAGVSDFVTGFTSPVLTSNPLILPYNSSLRMDIMSTMLGNPEGANITIYYRPISI